MAFLIGCLNNSSNLNNYQPDTLEMMREVLTPFMEDDECLFVASSDFCHWEHLDRERPARFVVIFEKILQVVTVK